MQNDIQHDDNSVTDSTLSSTVKADSTTTAINPRRLLWIALFMGFICEAFLHGQPPGFGYVAAAVSAIAIWLVAGRGQGIWPSKAGWGLLVVIAFVSLMVGIRASAVLTTLNIMTGIGLALLLAAVCVHGKLVRYSLTNFAIALFVSGLSAVIQPFMVFFVDLQKTRLESGKDRGLAPVLKGILLALPLLLIFGLLFASADAVFAAFMRQLFAWCDLTELIVRLILSLMLSWLVLGLLRHAFTRKAYQDSACALDTAGFPKVSGLTAITVLALVNALFLGFVAVQAVYLFGGADTLTNAGLSYSEYARRGFFELIAVAALVLSLTLLSDWLARGIAGGARRMINLLHTLLIVLTLIILASALLRMKLYTQEYGLTELRFYTTAFMVWLAVVLVWFVVTVVAGFALANSKNDGKGCETRRSFAFGAFVAGLAIIILLNLINPDAWIVRTNLKRAITRIGQPLDTKYITRTLSTDAVPTLLAGTKSLPNPNDRASLASHLQDKNQELIRSSKTLNWQGLNVSAIVARHLLSAADKLP